MNFSFKLFSLYELHAIGKRTNGWIECYKLVKNKWEFHSRIYNQNTFFNTLFFVTLHRKQIYLSYKSKIETFIRETNRLQDLSNPYTNSFHILVSFDNNLFAFNRKIKNNYLLIRKLDEKTEEWIKLPDTKITRFDDENVILENEAENKFEINFFYTVMNWIEKDIENRKIYLPRLLSKVSLKNLPYMFLRENVSRHHLIRNSSECLNLVFEALPRNIMDSWNYSSLSSIESKSSSVTHHVMYFLQDRYDRLTFVFSIPCQKLSSNEQVQNSAFVLEIKKSRFGATVIGNKIYVCGGWNIQDEKINNFEVFDCDLKAWTKLNPMKYALDNFNIISLNGFIYVTERDRFIIYRYDLANDFWEDIELKFKLEFIRHLFTFDNDLYSIYQAADDQPIECYKLVKNKWKFVSELCSREESSREYKGKKLYFFLQPFSTALLKNKIYISHGRMFKRFGPKSKKVQILPILNPESSLLFSFDQKLFAFHTKLFDQTLKVEEFDLNKLEWRALPEIKPEFIKDDFFV